MTGRIPKGKVTTYAELARALGKPDAQRAVGQALKRNENAPAIPCHRVVRSDGNLGGYSGREEKMIRKKLMLLKKEGIEIKKGKIELERFMHRFDQLSYRSYHFRRKSVGSKNLNS